MMWWTWLLVGVAIGMALGYPAGFFDNRFKVVSPEQLSTLMEAIVNTEEATEQRNLKRKELHDAKRRTYRLDGGKPAKVHRMRVRKVPTRSLED